jgi:general transcription factor 3C polypeptide 5 (transcription factor C subunit 1)
MEATTDGETDDELKQLISVSLRPDDPFAKRLLSTAVTTNNLLLKVTVPKRTGRKRKRGTSGSFLSEEDIAARPKGTSNGNPSRVAKTYVDASTIFRSLQDNASTYKVSVAGLVDETHRFRSKCPGLQR